MKVEREKIEDKITVGFNMENECIFAMLTAAKWKNDLKGSSLFMSMPEATAIALRENLTTVIERKSDKVEPGSEGYCGIVS